MTPGHDLSEVAINESSINANELIAAPAAGSRIRVYKFFLYVAAVTNLKFQTAVTDLHPAIPFAAGEKWILDYDSQPWLTCAVAEALNLHSSVAVQLSGRLFYRVEVG
jgi:hypothetical protein